jgi:hypothetical protein
MTLFREPIATTLDNFVEIALRGTKKEMPKSLLGRILYSPRMKSLIRKHHADTEIYLQSKIQKELSEQLTDAIEEDKKYTTALLMKTAKKIPISKDILACHKRFIVDMDDYITLMQNIRHPYAVLQAAETLNLPDCEAARANAMPAFKIYLLMMRALIDQGADKMVLYSKYGSVRNDPLTVRVKYRADGKWDDMLPVPYPLIDGVYTKIKAEAGMRPAAVDKTAHGKINHVIFNKNGRKEYDFSVKVEPAKPYEKITLTKL